MKPIKLKIKGLNSFIEEQVIDFETLTDRGLFGIFGPTGSGKSSILDGITLALYGDVSRKSSNYINTNCDRLNISFEFQISGAINKRYVIDREFKRKKDTGAPQSGKCKIVDVTTDEAEVLADKVTAVNECVKAIIGLSLEDFTRTVVLPQGKFSEFLRLEGKDRRNMLERLFNLQKYGDNLSSKLIKEINKVKTNNSVLLGQLTGYEDVSEELLSERTAELKACNDTLKKVMERLNNFETIYKDNELLWNLQLELTSYLKEEEFLMERATEINAKGEALAKGEAANKVVPYIKALETTISEIELCEKELESLTSLINTLLEQRDLINRNWEKAKSDKENKLPEILLKRQKTEDAIEEKKNLNTIISKIEVLTSRISKGEVMDKDGDSKLSLLLEKIKIGDKELKDREKDFDELKIDEDLKEKVQDALIEIERLNNYKTLINTNHKRIEEIQKLIINEKNKEEELNKRFHNVKEELEKYEKEASLLKSPGDQKDLLDLQESLSKLQEKWSAYNRLEMDIADSNKNIEELRLVLDKNKDENRRLEDNLANLKKSLKEKERESIALLLRKDLVSGKECPVCGSLDHHLHNIKVVESFDLEGLEAEIKVKENKIKELSSLITTNETKISNYLDKIKSNEDEINKLGSKFKMTKPEDLSVKLEDLKKSIEEYVKTKESLDFKITNNKGEVNLLNNDISNTKLLINNYKTQLEALEAEIKIEKEKLTLSEENLAKLSKETNISNFQEKNNEIKRDEKRREELSKAIKALRDTLDNLLKSKDDTIKYNQKIKDTLNQCYSELEVLKNNKVEKEKSIIDKVGLEKDLETLLSRLNTEINNIECIYKDLEEKKNTIEKDYTETNNKLISIKTKNEELKKREILDKDNLKIWIDNTGFNTLEEVNLNIKSEDEINLLKSEIEKYNEGITKINGAKESLLKKINGRELSEDRWEEIKGEKSIIEEEVNRSKEEKIKLEEEVNLLKNKLKELSNLLEKKKEVDHKLALLNDLEKLFKGKKFVEFVAANQLKYVSIEASKRLKEITGGSYGLEVDDFGKFIIRDYKNGGAERDASTLSGGETFLASLALALALSAQIQLKGTAPLELFFLDEGFGTLDDNLLEVVMNSLERIHNDKLKVGIISHVESIKNRVPVKLILTPAEAGMGGSKVRIEKS